MLSKYHFGHKLHCPYGFSYNFFVLFIISPRWEMLPDFIFAVLIFSFLCMEFQSIQTVLVFVPCIFQCIPVVPLKAFQLCACPFLCSFFNFHFRFFRRNRQLRLFIAGKDERVLLETGKLSNKLLENSFFIFSFLNDQWVSKEMLAIN